MADVCCVLFFLVSCIKEEKIRNTHIDRQTEPIFFFCKPTEKVRLSEGARGQEIKIRFSKIF